MAVFLKIMCFTIWMVIMLVLIHGSSVRKQNKSQQIYAQLTEDDEKETMLRKASPRRNFKDRLMVNRFLIQIG